MKTTLTLLAIVSSVSLAEDFTLSTYYTDSQLVNHVTLDAVVNSTQSGATSIDGITGANYSTVGQNSIFTVCTGQLLSSSSTSFHGLTNISVSSISMLSRPDGGSATSTAITVIVDGKSYTSTGVTYTAGTPGGTYGTLTYSFADDVIQMRPGSTMAIRFDTSTGIGVVQGQASSATTIGGADWFSALTLNCNAGSVQPISGQSLTKVTCGVPASGASVAFNFMIQSEDDATNGAIIAAYYSDYTAKNSHNTNAFYLTTSNGQIYLSAGEGHVESVEAHDNPTEFTPDGNRTVTLGNAALEVGVEYTIVTTTSTTTATSQTVYLYKGTELLASGSYNGFMDGNNAQGTELSVYSNALFTTPEPSTATLSLLALGGLVMRRRRS